MPPSLPNSAPRHLLQQSGFMYFLTSACAFLASSLNFFGSPASGDQNAWLTVIESPNNANVPLAPVNLAWTLRIGSIHASFLSVASPSLSVTSTRYKSYFPFRSEMNRIRLPSGCQAG